MTQSESTPGIVVSRNFSGWLRASGCSLAFTTYGAGKLFLVGTTPDEKLAVTERTFRRCMALHASDNALFLSSIYQLWRLENALPAGQRQGDTDAVFVPQLAWTTGDIDVHDIALDKDGTPLFVASRFNCIASASQTHSFEPRWLPPFISGLVAEDRCHLNGLAMHQGAPRWVTAVSRADVVDGWRDGREDEGIVIDVAGNEVVAQGLSMPHSPRWHTDRLWLLNAGSGQLGYVDPAAARVEFQPVAFAPGYLRGLTFMGDYAFVGLSLPRRDHAFRGLALETELEKRNAQARCGINIIDTRTGDTVHWLRMDGLVEEIYDVAIIRNCLRPDVVGITSEAIHHTISLGTARPL